MLNIFLNGLPNQETRQGAYVATYVSSAAAQSLIRAPGK